MAKKRRSRKKSSNNNSIVTIVIIIVILATISVVTAYFMLDDKEKSFSSIIETVINTDSGSVETDEDIDNTTKEVEEDADDNIKTPIDGTWVSNYDGAMLTITGLTFTVDFPSVDANSKVSGQIAVENTIVSFTNTTGNKACLNKEGHYDYSFIGDEMKLNLIKDPCESRVQRMSETWFKL